MGTKIDINKWGTKKDRTVHIFNAKRRCHSEFPLHIMAALDIIDSDRGARRYYDERPPNDKQATIVAN